MKAHEFLERGVQHMKDRAALRDSPEGERSMGRTVAAFNAMFGTDLTEVQGWQFMELLKMSRSTQGEFHADDHEDGAAFAGLAGEAAFKADCNARPDAAIKARENAGEQISRNEFLSALSIELMANGVLSPRLLNMANVAFQTLDIRFCSSQIEAEMAAISYMIKYYALKDHEKNLLKSAYDARLAELRRKSDEK